jgi:hypothetical protein
MSDDSESENAIVKESLISHGGGRRNESENRKPTK